MLLSILGKLFTHILLNLALIFICSGYHPQQAGFMPNCSTTDHISVPWLVIEKFREFQKDCYLYIACMDVKAALDAVTHRALWHTVMTMGVPGRIINPLTKLYNGAESCIQVNSKDSGWFPISNGVNQGCVPAPELFNCTINYLMSQVSQRIPGMQLSNYQLSDLEHADHTMLFCESIINLESPLNIYCEEAVKLGLKVNWSKTKLMHVGDDPHCSPHQSG